MFLRVGLLVLASLALMACNGLNQKVGMMSSTSPLSAATNGDGSNQPGRGGGAGGGVQQPGRGGGAGGGVQQPGGGGPAGGGISQPRIPQDGSVPVVLVCSDRGSSQTTSFQAALAAGKPVALAVNGAVCTSDANTISSMLISGSISYASLKTLCPAAVPASGSITLTLLIDGESQSTSYNRPGSNSLTVVWDANPERSDVPESSAAACTKTASPLVVNLPQNPVSPLKLNLAPSIKFDIMGAALGHKKIKIDWFSNFDYRFIALPDRNGNINGVDQLFGNNTTGPDGQMAANGYAALAKYDGMSADGKSRLRPADGKIDSSDAVYSQLRVWLDKNFDGVAQKSELQSLDSVNIKYIDLIYSDSFPEVDDSGNQSLMKSVVGMRDGSMQLLFDLWFAVDFN